MNLSSFKNALSLHPNDAVAFILPDGAAIPVHAHVTEVGRTEKTFLDCGGKFRRIGFASLQIWVADDLEHRLPAGKLAAILAQAETFLGADDPEMQVECQLGTISLFSISSFESRDGILSFTLESKQTACLAMEECLPAMEECLPAMEECLPAMEECLPAMEEKREGCCGPSGCC